MAVAKRRANQILVVFLIVGGLFLIAQHRDHLIPYLPWLVLAACPLMHVFMHHGHGSHQGHSGHDEKKQRRS
jgi:hypothetical protein